MAFEAIAYAVPPPGQDVQMVGARAGAALGRLDLTGTDVAAAVAAGLLV